MEQRDSYLSKLIQWIDKDVIKVITGVRRCGKSSLLVLFKEYLESQGVSDSNIVFMNFESLTYDEITDYKKLYTFLEARQPGYGE